MDLKPCPDCGNPISQQAAFCPKCGCPAHPSFRQQITVSDLNIGFGNMVGLLIKLALAFIPAAIILVAVGAVIVSIFAGALHR